MTAFLEVTGLGKRFPQRAGRPPSPWILKDLSFDVADGEFLTIVGPSGSGKTTLLNIIAQTDTASEGAIAFGGKSSSITDPAKLDPGLNRRIGPLGTALMLWDVWHRLSPAQRQWVVEQARVQGPRIVKQAMDAQRARRRK